MKKKYIRPELCDLFAVARGAACPNGNTASLCGDGTSAATDCDTGDNPNQS